MTSAISFMVTCTKNIYTEIPNYRDNDDEAICGAIHTQKSHFLSGKRKKKKLLREWKKVSFANIFSPINFLFTLLCYLLGLPWERNNLCSENYGQSFDDNC